MCINPLPITNLLTNVLRAPSSASSLTAARPSTLKAHEVALRNKKGREVLMMDLKVSAPFPWCPERFCMHCMLRS